MFSRQNTPSVFWGKNIGEKNGVEKVPTCTEAYIHSVNEYNKLWESATNLQAMLGTRDEYTCMGMLVEAINEGINPDVVVQLAMHGLNERRITEAIRDGNAQLILQAHAMVAVGKAAGHTAETAAQGIECMAAVGMSTDDIKHSQVSRAQVSRAQRRKAQRHERRAQRQGARKREET